MCVCFFFFGVWIGIGFWGSIQQASVRFWLCTKNWNCYFWFIGKLYMHSVTEDCTITETWYPIQLIFILKIHLPLWSVDTFEIDGWDGGFHLIKNGLRTSHVNLRFVCVHQSVCLWLVYSERATAECFDTTLR